MGKQYCGDMMACLTMMSSRLVELRCKLIINIKSKSADLDLCHSLVK